MRHNRRPWNSALCIAWIAYSSLLANAQPASPPPVAPEKKSEPSKAVSTQTSTPQAPGQPPSNEEPPTEADKFVQAAADKIDGAQYVSAQMVQVVKVADKTITAKGIYKKAPGYKARFELDVDLGDSVGKRLIVCDGKTGYMYRKVLEVEELNMIKLDQVLPLLERKELPIQNKRRILSQLPILDSGEMLRGYLSSVTFDRKVEREMGQEQKRKVVVVEGHWRKRALDSLVGGAPTNDLTSLGGNLPQYVRLYLDQETSWPLKIELFRRDKQAEWKPIFVLEFPSVSIGTKIPDEDFVYTPPKNVQVQDVTAEWIGLLQNLKDRPGAPAAAPATPASAAGAVSAPLDRPAKPAEKTSAKPN